MIRHYALERGAITLEHAIRVSTSLPATILRLADQGYRAVVRSTGSRRSTGVGLPSRSSMTR